MVVQVGDNGSGKTTLLKILNGEFNPTAGVRHVHRNLVIGYFTQHHVDQLELGISSLEFMAKQFPGGSLGWRACFSASRLQINEESS